MKISKIKIKNLFGIKEYEADGKSIELVGKNGTGKSSVIDAIKYALTNRSDRDYIIRKGETEGEIYIETDTGISIDRKSRANQSDYKSIKQSGTSIASPEFFLKELFTNLQLNPVEFLNMTKQQQNAIILDMIEYDWNLETIKNWFGEIPSWINYDQNILQVLSDIQSEKGEYFTKRQDINRDIRTKRAFVDDIAKSIPANFDVDKWENESLGDIYKEIEKKRNINQHIRQAKAAFQNYNNKLRGLEAEREINKTSIEKEIASTEQSIEQQISDALHSIEILREKKNSLAANKQEKLKVADAEYLQGVAELSAELQSFAEYKDKEFEDTSLLEEKAAEIEKMKSYINEYKRMQDMEAVIEKLKTQSDILTAKISKARELPGEILAECSIPIEGLTVENGIPLIHGLPVSNLSDGEKLDLCVDVAIQNPNGLHIILIDGIERLATGMREKLYQKCRNKGLQFIATRTTDDDELNVIEL